MMKLSDWDDVLATKLASMTPDERRAYDEYDAEAEAQIRTAELVYEMRTKAGLTQSELARRVGTKQPYVSAIESGGQAPTVATLMKLAKATGNRIVVEAVPA